MVAKDTNLHRTGDVLDICWRCPSQSSGVEGLPGVTWTSFLTDGQNLFNRQADMKCTGPPQHRQSLNSSWADTLSLTVMFGPLAWAWEQQPDNRAGEGGLVMEGHADDYIAPLFSPIVDCRPRKLNPLALLNSGAGRTVHLGPSQIAHGAQCYIGPPYSSPL